ncbi:DUF281 domain-containing protein [Caenorhabditis elegans]|uniref:DUF281 domain-containing protein n=1 Tax=Caenorhabditis elegans TaxID=6239 RepID=Q9XWM9_CAEEL|nr:DUF281 domain-containing protein [Caenorhabditis elegans]CAA21623.2 DUF281 domain-containing protein [Caenorhabditis elegans]|eukprot:NP_507815.2 Uncharacterized protein CELE_Y43F8C.15 [Caenorhabditis elegans]
MPIFQLVLFFVVFSEALAQDCHQGCETFPTEKSVIESDGKSYVRIYTNTTIVNGCKAVMFKCVVVDRSTDCETTASFVNLATSKITKKYNTTDETQDTSYSGEPMICARVPGSSINVGYFYEGQQVRPACSNRCVSGGGPPALLYTFKPDPRKDETTTVEPKPIRHAGGCRARRP